MYNYQETIFHMMPIHFSYIFLCFSSKISDFNLAPPKLKALKSLVFLGLSELNFSVEYKVVILKGAMFHIYLKILDFKKYKRISKTEWIRGCHINRYIVSNPIKIFDYTKSMVSDQFGGFYKI